MGWSPTWSFVFAFGGKSEHSSSKPESQANQSAREAGELADTYFASLCEEMRMVADLGYDFESLYIGGGTPTIDLAKELFHIREVSSETNPNHLYPEWVDPLSERVDRLSVGVHVPRKVERGQSPRT